MTATLWLKYCGEQHGKDKTRALVKQSCNSCAPYKAPLRELPLFEHTHDTQKHRSPWPSHWRCWTKYLNNTKVTQTHPQRQTPHKVSAAKDVGGSTRGPTCECPQDHVAPEHGDHAHGCHSMVLCSNVSIVCCCENYRSRTARQYLSLYK